MPIISVVSAVQVSEAIKLLTGQPESLHKSLMQFDVWRNEWRKINPGPPAPDCPTCARGEYATLNADAGEVAAVLCGRNAVQISPVQSTQIDFQALSDRLKPSGEVKFNDYLLRFRTGDFELTVFKDARSIIRGTSEINTARTLYAKFIGN
jgi:adenylyltransferase/sulfurtransferase